MSPESFSPEAGFAVLGRTLEELRVGVCVWRLERDDTPASLRLVIINPAACRFLGVARAQVLGKTIHEGFPGSEAMPLPGIFTDLAMQGGECDLGVVPYGDEIVARGMFSIHATAIGSRLVCVEFTNVTEQKRLEGLQQTNDELVQRLSSHADRSRSLVIELEQQLEIIARQNDQIHALSSPILDLWEGVLAVPIIGEFTNTRAAGLTASLLEAVATRRSRAVILDVTGISLLDHESAGHLGRLIVALRLLGAEGVVTGIRPQLAQTLAALGQDAVALRTYRSLSDGLRACIDAAATSPRG